MSLYSASVPSRSAAALAYRGIFSLAPLLLISVLVLSIFVGRQAAQEEINTVVESVLIDESAEMLETSLQVMSWQTDRGYTLTSLIGIGFLIYAASALFKELKIALHSVWGLPPAPKKGPLAFIITQVTAISMVLLVGFFFLLLFLVNVVISLLDTYAFPGELISLRWGSWLGSLMATALLIGLMYRLVPDVSLPWSDLWVGALVTTVLMMVGIWGINIYLTISDVGSAAGTAGAIIIFLVGFYYAAQVFLFGASFAAAYAKNFGSKQVWQELEQFNSDTVRSNSNGEI